MTDAPRYRLVGYDIGTAPDENGGWVHWTDHEVIVARLTAERDRFEAALGRACLVGGTTYLLERAEKAEAERDAALPEVQALIAAAEARGMVKGLRGAAAIAWALEDGDRWTRSAVQSAILARAAEIEMDAK